MSGAAEPGAAGPLVSVVIPTFNRLPLLREAIASVQAQSYPHWELVVADDGSSDGTAAAVRALADPRIRCIELAHSGHTGMVRNRALAEARGELVAFLDSDDLWLPRKLELQVAAQQSAKARWSYTAYAVMDAQAQATTRRTATLEPPAGAAAESILADLADIAMVTVLAERALLEEVGGFGEHRGLTVREDWELSVRLALRAEPLALREPLSRVREHAGRTTTQRTAPFLAAAVACQQLLRLPLSPPLAGLARRQRAYHLALHASSLFESGEYLRAGGWFLRSLAGGPGLRRWLGAVHQGLDRRARRPRGRD